ncbi:DUF771 domain-containing protein [Jeotgalibaca porci]|uniref:DUF771 domain-containing protein n=1 Tax=Jeotgalibaca porci TaxID=1868793 RepID=UPI0035A12907
MTIWVGWKYIAKHTPYKNLETIKKHILIPHREEIEQFARYPEAKGQLWLFSEKHLKEWLENNVV